MGTASLPTAIRISLDRISQPQGRGESPSFLPFPHPLLSVMLWTCMGSTSPLRPQDSVSGREELPLLPPHISSLMPLVPGLGSP